MGKVKGKHRLDKYYKLAKEHGYRSRASWKLAQLDPKHQFLYSARAVLDLCVALTIGCKSLCNAYPSDITKPECTAMLRKMIKENMCLTFDLVLHDGSPNVGGAWSSEATT
ncbi:hypothetical protein ACFX2J_019583 [Malus domestica]